VNPLGNVVFGRRSRGYANAEGTADVGGTNYERFVGDDDVLLVPCLSRLSAGMPNLVCKPSIRELPTSTYVSLLVRARLRAQVPLPTAGLAALKRSVAEVGALGRNINQIARAVNEQQWSAGPLLHAMAQTDS
jgi:hypothetical protein